MATILLVSPSERLFSASLFDIGARCAVVWCRFRGGAIVTRMGRDREAGSVERPKAAR